MEKGVITCLINTYFFSKKSKKLISTYISTPKSCNPISIIQIRRIEPVEFVEL